MSQLALPLLGLTCAFGVAHEQHHDGRCCYACDAEGERLHALFLADVAAGVYDAEGYTPADRRLRAKRHREAAQEVSA